MKETTRKILDIFEEVSKIPRCSKNEEAIANWLKNWAKEHNFSVKSDDVDNILITIPATEGYEDSPILVLQGHMDMVCEKTPDSDHDFAKDPIELVYEDGWLTANNTTLGADNGIAIAMALALATDKSVKHPPLELLFTVDEETGLTGANALTSDFLDGRILLNIDSEDEGVFTVGCAGGRNTKISLDVERENIYKSFDCYKLSATGMMGGHSGMDIDKHRANANVILARTLNQLKQKNEIRLISISGGTAHNAIPRDAEAIIAFNSTNFEAIKEIVSDFEKTVTYEYQKETSLKLNLKETEKVDKIITEADTNRIIDMLIALPNGISEMSADIEDLVETSDNIATMRTEKETLTVLISQRSSVMSRREELTAKITAIASLAEADVENGEGYPAWQPNLDSEVLKKCKEIYTQVFGNAPTVEAIHAGLECGVIGAKYDGMDMISFGPTIKNPHSPDERIEIETIGQVWDFLVALVESYQ
jgi:dipeptidase D